MEQQGSRTWGPSSPHLTLLPFRKYASPPTTPEGGGREEGLQPTDGRRQPGWQGLSGSCQAGLS